MTPELYELKRNDVESALRVHDLGVAAGTWDAQDGHMMIMLQDDPTELFEALEVREREMKKALPRMSDEQRDEASKGVGVKASGASKKQAGANGKTRYTYPAEQQGSKAKPGDPQQQPAQQAGGGGEAGGAQQSPNDVLPHPETPPPQPEQAPIAAEHPDKPPQDDPRSPDPQKPQQPKHTINLGELCAALNIQRSVLQQIVTRMQKQFGEQAREKFVSFMQTQLKKFAEEHGLEGDYFGLLFDVLTGKVQEGQPSSQPQQPVAKKPGSV